MIHLRKQQRIPQHLDNLETISNGHHRVRFRHPAYQEGCNILLILLANDHPEGGIHHETARLACAIIAGNRWDGYLSESRDQEPLQAGPEEVLRQKNYYFHLSSDQDGFKYPVVPTFAHWRFPHDQLPPYWQAAVESTDNAPSSLRSNTSAALTLRDRTCRMSDHQEGCEMAHICPRSEDQWFHENEMWRYAIDAQKTGAAAIDDLSNLILLRSDLHKSFDKLKFVWVPKVGSNEHPSFVTHGLAESAELAKLYQNARLHEIPCVSREFLLARFAWSIFPSIQGFLQRNVERQVLIVALDSSQLSRSASAEECRGWIPQSMRSRSASPKKRARPATERLDEALEDTVGKKRKCLDSAKSRQHSDNWELAQKDSAPSADTHLPSTTPSASPSSCPSTNHIGMPLEVRARSVIDGERLESLRKQFLDEERQRSDPEGCWTAEQEWRKGALSHVVDPQDIRRLYEAYGVEFLEEGGVNEENG